MKLAIITSLNGGVGSFVLQLVSKLDKYPDISLIDIYAYLDSSLKINYSNFLNDINFNKVNINVLGNKYTFLFKLLFLLRKLKRYDIIQFIGPHTAFPFIRFSAGEVPIVSVNHVNPLIKIRRGNIFLDFIDFIERLFLNLAIFKSDVLVFPSYTYAKITKGVYGVLAGYVYHGVDSSKFRFDPVKREFVRNSLKIKDNEVVLLYVGKLWKHKDVLTLVRSIQYIIKEYKNIKLIIIGNGPEFDKVKYTIKKLNIEKFVKFIPYVEDISAYYSAADIFVMPSIREAFGLVYIEAMACNLPVIAADAHVVPEIVGNAGLLFRPRDSYDLSSKIILLLDNRNLYKKLKIKSLYKSKKFNWFKSAENYYKIYKRLIRR